MKKYLKGASYLIIVAGLAWFVSYALEQYKLGGADEGIFICDDEDCFKTVHIHSDIEFDLCGDTTIDLPREKGDLSGLHTHKEKNYLHFHDKLDLVPPAEGEIKTSTDDYEQEPDERLSIQMIIDTYDLQPEKYCGDVEAIILLEVNGETVTERRSYNRIDGDIVKLIYRK